MPENQTRPTGASVSRFIAGIENDTRRRDAKRVIAMMRKASGVQPKMWGPAIVGFGSQHYKYESGREGDMPQMGFSPRKQNLSLYLAKPEDPADLNALGKHSTSVSCLYIAKLADIDEKVLERMIVKAWKRAARRK